MKRWYRRDTVVQWGGGGGFGKGRTKRPEIRSVSTGHNVSFEQIGYC